VASTAEAQQATVYVKKGNNNPVIDGLSFDTGYPELADVLDPTSVNYVQLGDIVWVSRGTYSPDPLGVDRTKTFRIPTEVKVFGGFSGSEQVFSERAGLFSSTILTGDLDGVPANRAGDSYHVVTVQVDSPGSAYVDNVTLDGFTVQYGNADGTGNDDKGGGLLAHIEGALNNFNVRRLRVANCTFTENRAFRGAGMYVRGIEIIDTQNLDEGLIVALCTFDSNKAQLAGGFGGNGGGLYLEDIEEVHIYNSVFRDNTASQGGGAWIGWPSGTGSDDELDFYNCLFHDNEATRGGGVYLDEASWKVRLRNCTLSQNTASGQGGAVFIEKVAGGGATLHEFFNSVAWGNTGGEISGGPNSGWILDMTVENSDVQGGWTGPGTANINADPLFEDPTMNIFKLGSGSPCIEVGRNTYIILDLADLDGDLNTTEKVPYDLRPSFPRKQDADMNGVKTVDMGCYERTVGLPQ
jgi:Chlamydia polymorphic membrane protein (Chlamydia_PMP) repeat